MAMHRVTPVERAGGFTLVEMMMTIAVAAILSAIAVPAFRSFVQNGRLLTEANALVSAIDLARSEAVKFDASMEVCPSTDGATCNSANWAQGWIVVNLAGGLPVYVAPAVSTPNTITEKNGQTAIVYLSSGLTSLNLPAEFTLCDSRGAQYARYTEVAAYTGRVTSAPNIGQNLAGAALTCP